MPRFATASQISEVTGFAGEISAYQTKINNLIVLLAGYVEAFSPDSGIEIRYVTSEGRDMEGWRGNLLAASPLPDKVNLWLLTIIASGGLQFGPDTAIGTFDKIISVGIDYYYDWEFGTDTNNSEAVFNAKIDGLDRFFEKVRTCLPDGTEILEWDFRRSIMQFTNASTHVAKGDFRLKLSGL